MDHDMGNKRDLKKMVERYCSQQWGNGSFDEEGIKGEYDFTSEAVVIQPFGKRIF